MYTFYINLHGTDYAGHILICLKNWSFLNILNSYKFSTRNKKKNEKNFIKEKENEIIITHTSHFFFLKNFKISSGFYKFSYSIISDVFLYNRFFFFLNKLNFFKKLKSYGKNFSENFFFPNFINLSKKPFKKKIPLQNLDIDLFFLLTVSINIFSMNKKSCKKKNTLRTIFSIKNLFISRKKFSKKKKKEHKNFCFKKFNKIYSAFFFFLPHKNTTNEIYLAKNFLQFNKKKFNNFFLKFVRCKKCFFFFFVTSLFLNLFTKKVIRFTDLFLNYSSVNILKKIISYKIKKK